MAQNRQRFLDRFWTMGKRAVAKPSNEGPAAWVLDGAQKRQGNLHELLSVLDRHGIEIHQSDESFSMATNWPPPAGDKKPEPVKFAKGSYIVRMDQPYSRLADTLLDVQFVRGEERVYDDTGWTLGYLKNVSTHRVVNPDVLKMKMHRWTETAPSRPASPDYQAIPNHAETDLVRLRFAAPGARFLVAEEGFTAGKTKYPAGTVIARSADTAGMPPSLGAVSIAAMPNVRTHELRAPRIAGAKL
jgi:hypothetical protein